MDWFLTPSSMPNAWPSREVNRLPLNERCVRDLSPWNVVLVTLAIWLKSMVRWVSCKKKGIYQNHFIKNHFTKLHLVFLQFLKIIVLHSFLRPILNKESFSLLRKMDQVKKKKNGFQNDLIGFWCRNLICFFEGLYIEQLWKNKFLPSILIKFWIRNSMIYWP